MRSEKELQRLKEEYNNVRIPDELGNRVQDAIKLGVRKRRRYPMKWVQAVASAAAAVVLVVNISPTFADTLIEVPVLGDFVKVICFREYRVEGERQQANIKVPQVAGLGSEELENQINGELQAEADKVYKEFLEMAKEWEEVDSAAHYSVDMNYQVLTDTEDIFALRVNKVETIASANQQVAFYVIDKQNETALTLPTLFKDDSYVSVISEYVVGQMKEAMKKDENKIYWVNEDDFAKFESIEANQKFYINKEGQLVIYFDKYEVAPGAMGESEFIIPTELISDLLVNHNIIK